ncbi:hypothetical protein DL98DRAFT_521866 [Cadophora sp. DSE1049]|nr:hypothetical protein DL98DRAFT_521866 [Cadophora sp. DSE1049]
MGYSEISCQICAVSFNIARLRTKDEPPESGWGYSHGLSYAGDVSSSLCSMYSETSGCENDYDAEPDGLHFPGRGCTFTGGMNGWKIGAGEMKGMRHPRYIILKPTNWDVEKEEQNEYERKSDYFVTSQTTEVPDDWEPGELAKIRFGIDTFFPRNYGISTHSDEMQVGIPVHASCWEIFERVSKLRLGEVDLQGFMALWHRQACGTCGFRDLQQDPIIRKCKEQFWTHLPGTEYFGANPVDVPGLMLHLYSFYLTEPAGNNISLERPSSQENGTDNFRLLPVELRTMILSNLSSKDISSLRQVSRSFQCLPKQLFLQLIRRELPWFWEFDELEAFMEKVRVDFNKMVGMPERDIHPFNWYVLYKQLCLAKKNILGVRNRVRVWDVVEAIVERIQRLRDGLGEGDDLSVLPTEKEKEDVVVHCGLYCTRCDPNMSPLGMYVA